MAASLLTLAGFKEAGALNKLLFAWKDLDGPQASWLGAAGFFLVVVLRV